MIWFDLDNSPHVPLFVPILKELDKRGEHYKTTARDFAQTADLLRLWNIPHAVIGGHGGRSIWRKVLNTIHRSGQLSSHIGRNGTVLAVSHGSRSQVVAARRLGLPSVVMLDYEYTESRIFNIFATNLLMPALIPEMRLKEAGFNLRKLIRYQGFKEEIYLNDFVARPGFRREIGIDERTILVTMRPPSITGNYHHPRSEMLFRKSVEVLASLSAVHCLIVNRTDAESGLFQDILSRNGNVTLLPHAVDGLQLLWHSDVVISGGGTMNREAALLGVPAYSVFTGQKPYLDEYLQQHGKLEFIETAAEVESIQVKKRRIPNKFTSSNTTLASDVTDILLDLSKRTSQ